MQTRGRIHHLVDELAEQELTLVERYLLDLHHGDTLQRVLRQAPVDDESETDEERAAVQEAYDDVAAGRLVSHDEARRRLLGER